MTLKSVYVETIRISVYIEKIEADRQVVSVISLQVTDLNIKRIPIQLVRVYYKTDVDQDVQKKAQECFKEWCSEYESIEESGKSSCAVIFAIM